jgi:hypothetical protein
VAARAVGWIAAAPPGPLDGTAIRLHGADYTVMAVCAGLVV